MTDEVMVEVSAKEMQEVTKQYLELVATVSVFLASAPEDIAMKLTELMPDEQTATFANAQDVLEQILNKANEK